LRCSAQAACQLRCRKRQKSDGMPTRRACCSREAGGDKGQAGRVVRRREKGAGMGSQQEQKSKQWSAQTSEPAKQPASSGRQRQGRQGSGGSPCWRPLAPGCRRGRQWRRWGPRCPCDPSASARHCAAGTAGTAEAGMDK
jgi:hypothetical protein